MTFSILLFQPYNWQSAFPVLRVLGPAAHLGWHVIPGNAGGDIDLDAISRADVVVIQREFPQNLALYSEIVKRTRQLQKPLIYDLDDWLLDLPPEHPDRQDGFYAEALLPIFQALFDADLVTTSTPTLAQAVGRFNPNVSVLPNYLDDRFWHLPPDVRRLPAADDGVVIGYMGSASHLHDVGWIAPVLERLDQKYSGRLVFRFWGLQPPENLARLPNVERIPLEIYDYQAFAEFFQQQQADIFIAPLLANTFNHCKSEIKFLEYSSHGVPGVYSAVGPYVGLVEQGVNGFLAASLADWETGLSDLIERPDLRLEMGRNALETVGANWRLSQNAEKWRRVYTQATGRIAAHTLAPQVFLSVAAQLQSWATGLENQNQLAQQAQQDAARESENYQNQLTNLNLRFNQAVAEGDALAQNLDAEKQHSAQLKDALTYSQALHQSETEKVQALIRQLDAEIQSKNYVLAKNRNLLQKNEQRKQILARLKYQLQRATHQLSAQRVEVQTLQQQLTAQDQHCADLKAQYNRQVYDLSVSREYQHGAELVRLVDAVAPIGSPQKRMISAAYDFGIQLKHRLRRTVPVLAPQPDNAVQLPRPYDVIVFPIINWHFRFQRPQQIALEFAKAGHRVFYLNHDFQDQAHVTVGTIAPNIFEVHLTGRPVNIYADQMSKTHEILIRRAFDTLRRDFDIQHAVVLVDFPFWAPAALALRESFGWPVIYDCMDDHGGFSTSSAKTLAAEDRLLQKCDLTLTTSRLLYTKKKNRTPNCVFLPNAGDFAHFNPRPPQKPEELAGLTGPIIGYYGAIADWFDTGLVAALALQKPDWHFVLIGSTASADLIPLQGCRNVHLLGEKPYRDLPAYLHHFDVCFIPFRRTPLTEATNPVKLFEYLAAGKPVVATGLDEIQHYADVVALANNPDQWLAALDQALHAETPRQIDHRIEFARQNTWAVRGRFLRTQIAQFFPKASIIVLTYNNLHYTRQCLESIYARTIYPHFEVIVVDNASQDGTPEFLGQFAARHPNMQVILNTENVGFAAGNNLGARQADGAYLIFLNNDTIVTQGWLARLLDHLAAPGVGMVGPVTNWSGNETCIPVDYTRLDEMPAFAARYTRQHWGQTFDIRVLAFLCVALRRPVFDEIGWLDERFGRGMFEDDDYAQRLSAKGYRLICAEDVFVHHWGKASFSRLDEAVYQQVFEENRRKYEEKWGFAWEPHSYRDSKH